MSLNLGLMTVRALRGLGQVALWLCALLGLACLVGGVAAVVLGVRPMVVQSGSMSPAIPTGSVVLTVATPAAEVQPGDVVSTLDSTGLRVMHRVVESRPVGAEDEGPFALTLRGDANATPDAEPYLVASLDRVVADAPYLGYVIAWASGSLGAVLLGAVVSALGLSVVWGRRSAPRAGDHRPSHRGARRSPRAARAAAVAAVVALVAGVWLSPSSRPAGTAAAFSDLPVVAASVASAPVPGPAGAVGCANGSSSSGTLTISWPAVAGQSARYRYRVEIYAASNLASNLLKSYVLIGNSQVVPHSDLDRNVLWSGTASVRVHASIDGSEWRSVSDIRRTIYVGLTGLSYRCEF